MKIVFAGTPEFAAPTLQALHREGHEIALVVTQPDRPRGRGMKLAPPALKLTAQELGLPVEQPEKMRGEAGHRILAAHQPDAVVIVAYGEIIPGDLLAIPRHGWINLHASLLPNYRGAAPIQWAIIRGEERTGVTTMRIDEGMDTGPVFLREEIQIADDDTTSTLSGKLAEAGAGLMVQTLGRIGSETIEAVPQDHSQATRAPLLKKKHGRVDWTEPAPAIYNRIRGLLPWPVAYTGFRDEPLKLYWGRPATPPDPAPAAPGTVEIARNDLYVACGGGSWLRLEEVQLAGRKRMRASDFINGLHVESGEPLVTPAE